jgi:hypothetical protein
MIALPNRGFLRVGERSAHHASEVAEKNFPLWEAKIVNPVAGISFGVVAHDWDPRNRKASP